MLAENPIAFKEWAVACETLRLGRQSLILRKGGIHEGRAGFRVDHREFWLFPTEFHQQPDVLAPQAQPLLAEIQSRSPLPGTTTLQHYVTVDQVLEIHDESVLPRLSGLHVWSESTLHARFHYRTPMLFALLVRCYEAPEPFTLPESPHFAGCRSWVDLEQTLSTGQLRPVLTDEEHAAQMATIQQVLSP